MPKRFDVVEWLAFWANEALDLVEDEVDDDHGNATVRIDVNCPACDADDVCTHQGQYACLACGLVFAADSR